VIKNVPMFGIGNVGKSPNVSAQQRTNLYVELQSDPESNGLALFPTPGLTSFVTLAGVSRGLHQMGDYFYSVNGSKLNRIANDGTFTEAGALLTTTGRVDMSDNGTQLVITDGTYGYTYNTSTSTFARIVDAYFPIPSSNTYLNSYTVVSEANSGRYYISTSYDATAWAALDFATAEGSPDNLVRVFADNGVLYLFGDKTTEVHGDSGATDFPFTRIGASAIEWGLAAKWSLAKFMDSLIFLRKNRLGAVQVCILSGTQAMPVSNPEMDYVFSQYSAVSDATGFAYMVSGHPMYQINFPSAGESWLYDGISKCWSRLQSNGGRHKAEIQVQFLDKSYVSDYATGRIYRLDQNAYDDDGDTIVREFVSRHNKSGDYLSISQLWLEMESGVGLVTGQGSDPRIMMQVSRDGGKTWGAERWANFGKEGEYGARALWNRLGRSRDWLFRFRVTDPVKTVFVAAWANYGA
jgi:hypothetical protein